MTLDEALAKLFKRTRFTTQDETDLRGAIDAEAGSPGGVEKLMHLHAHYDTGPGREGWEEFAGDLARIEDGRLEALAVTIFGLAPMRVSYAPLLPPAPPSK